MRKKISLDRKRKGIRHETSRTILKKCILAPKRRKLVSVFDDDGYTAEVDSTVIAAAESLLSFSNSHVKNNLSEVTEVTQTVAAAIEAVTKVEVACQTDFLSSAALQSPKEVVDILCTMPSAPVRRSLCFSKDVDLSMSSEEMLPGLMALEDLPFRDEENDIRTKINQPTISRCIGLQCSRAPVSYQAFKSMSVTTFKFFTGITQESFEALYEFIGGSTVCSKLKYAYKDGTPRKQSLSTLEPCDRLFMTLMRMRRGYPIVDLAMLFHVSKTWVSSIVYTWIRLLSLQLGKLRGKIFPSANVQNMKKAPHFKDFPNLRAIIDGTDIKIQHPYNFQKQTNTFSNYKQTNTVKYLIVCSCFGGISFVSEGMEGSMSDKQLLLKSGFLDELKEGDVVMCDRGFDVEAELNAIGVGIVVPPFKGKDRSKFTARECIQSKAISSARIFIEIAIGKIKEFRLLRGQVPNTLLPVLDDIVFIAAMLTLFNPSFIV